MVLHTVASVDHEASGPSYTVPRLCKSLLALGVDTQLAVLDWVPGADSPPYVKRFPLGWGPRRLGRSPAMARWLQEQVSSGAVDVLHNHGLWMMPNVYPATARRRGNARLVLSPRGTVSEWAMNHHRWRKRIMWHVGQRAALSLADGFHATAEMEYQDIRRLGFRQPVAVIPNGIDIPEYLPKPIRGPRRLLYLGRIHKKKGVDVLLRAWRAVQDRYSDWGLVIAGPDDGGFLAQYQALSLQLGLQRVSFPGPVYGADKLALYRSAHLYVLPTHSDNYAMTVAEALAAGTPAIVTKGAPWQGLEREGAGWWIETGVDALVASLEHALALPPEQLAAMGAAGRLWMEREFSWQDIGRQMAAFYAWICGAGPEPLFVRKE
jgi:glycosyltransferase involved in cell wall biosynthesis